MDRGPELHHVAIRAIDVAVVARFYRDVVGLAPLPCPRPDAMWLRLGGGTLMVEPARAGAVGSDDGEPGLFLLAFRIAPDERAVWRSRLRAAGVEIESESAFTIYVRDPEGNRVGLSHHPDAPAS